MVVESRTRDWEANKENLGKAYDEPLLNRVRFP